jgi:hypothetical protein
MDGAAGQVVYGFAGEDRRKGLPKLVNNTLHFLPRDLRNARCITPQTQMGHTFSNVQKNFVDYFDRPTRPLFISGLYQPGSA